MQSARGRRMRPFMFATGIENSNPIVRSRAGTMRRVDEMAATGHYDRWREDFQLVRELGVEYLRWGPPYHLVHIAPGRYDWSFADQALAELQRLGITPIVDLCHFGVPDWIGDFQNEDWPGLFAEYARAFAQRYGWVRFYTPVNEIYVAATFSAHFGWWNECLTGDRAFVTSLKHLCKATLLAEDAIARVQSAALFIQSESTEYFHALEPGARALAAFLNARRFLPLDLCYGHEVRAKEYRYLTEGGLRPDEYDWFQSRGRMFKSRCIMGTDYYVTNEHSVAADGTITPSGEIFGYYVITKQYFERYRLPVMHTETNLDDAERAPAWLWKQWANLAQLKNDGVPIIGFTWYSLLDQVDWDTALRESNGNVNPVGLFDLDRKIRPVGEAYRRLVREWRDILPVESVCLCPPHAELAEIGASAHGEGQSR
jgi:beta-glucosidase/6-phospho-beta-glucosidase/beta-galactosidase